MSQTQFPGVTDTRHGALVTARHVCRLAILTTRDTGIDDGPLFIPTYAEAGPVILGQLLRELGAGFAFVGAEVPPPNAPEEQFHDRGYN